MKEHPLNYKGDIRKSCRTEERVVEGSSGVYLSGRYKEVFASSKGMTLQSTLRSHLGKHESLCM